MCDKSSELLSLLEKPFLPFWVPRNDGKIKLTFPPGQKPLDDRDSNGTIYVEAQYIVHNMDFAKVIGLDEAFSDFNPKHLRVAGKLTEIFMNAENHEELLSNAIYAKDQVNVYLFLYSFSVALVHRPDTKHLCLPSIVTQLPNEFMSPCVFSRLNAESKRCEKDRKSVEIPHNISSSLDETEQRMAYFREDIGINLHHWQWHLIYPASGRDAIVKKDRRGELFFYMHSQILARYNADRMANGLEVVKKLSLDEPILEAYFPKINHGNSQRTYAARPAESKLRDVNRDNTKVEIDSLKRWRDRIFDAIDCGYAIDKNNNQIKLDEVTGIDILGNMVESSETMSINRKLYGSLHNSGHDIISFTHDPDGRHLEDMGVLGSTATAMRDPVFYRWHTFIDSIFLHFKRSLPEYPREQLEFRGISVKSIRIKDKHFNPPKFNLLSTFWQKSHVDLKAGLDFGSDGSLFVAFKHLQHNPFTYSILVTNNNRETMQGTCRIFIAPKTTEKGRALELEEQQRLMIEMDKFTVDMPEGETRIKRSSNDSSVTIPFERTFSPISRGSESQFCRCGWPSHMLLPKANVVGVDYVLFVVISNIKDDLVENLDVKKNCGENCGDAHSFCGSKDKKYPDKRTMGYPFDRLIRKKNGEDEADDEKFQSLDEFIQKYSNMAMQSITIKFTDEVQQELETSEAKKDCREPKDQCSRRTRTCRLQEEISFEDDLIDSR